MRPHGFILLAALAAADRAGADAPAPPPEPPPLAHHAAPQPSTQRPRQPAAGARARIVAIARGQVGKRFTGDCSGFVRSVFRTAGVPLPQTSFARTGSEAIFRSLGEVGTPRPGDVVVFHDTYGAGRRRFTHVGIVEAVHGSHVRFIHRDNQGVRRSTMNLSRPSDPHENDAVRRRRSADDPGQRYLAGELFSGYASAFGRDARMGRSVHRAGGHMRGATRPAPRVSTSQEPGK